MQLLLTLGDPRLLKASFTSDQAYMTLEVTPEGSKVGKDTPPTTIYRLLREMEAQGLVEVSITNHKVTRPTGSLTSTADDCFKIVPDGTKLLVMKYAMPTAKTSLSQYNAASHLPAAQSGTYYLFVPLRSNRTSPRLT